VEHTTRRSGSDDQDEDGERSETFEDNVVDGNTVLTSEA